MLPKLLEKIKTYQYLIFLVLCFGLISFISFNLGKINALEKSPIKVGESGNLKTINTDLKADIYSSAQGGRKNQTETKKLDTRVVVSKTSTSKKYHYSWCASASKIKEENKLWFNSDKEAEAAGYTLAGNCIK
ncbi:MAG: hypothetical protein A3B86_01040 [Candidatus Yanofskybacteria bacterium RIFCSPHIGHO2_02_FULL_38_22b]|uniref:Ada DNA repair metal-binding domain-containing protein n=1 Tax=Candidatus Yanofskybacteria bacterium RIFCSPHIGHO2_02_FULL_38_22b TaxID=1802673 RepID=A0A1F8F2F8_9BACT|nr:MAG: hypothetical protein A3B86_01040 [Candidatus Yanofskybacteria bacterium RIFCSPHIGHO2_02_FULL_38_22b]OGN20378.1 MAG: hypothetical protein A2910_01390 [Candidatus Yanofskybacteria bacterium RIFCSPLOWO2_01_FULL_39_28]